MREVIGELLEVAGYIRTGLNATNVYAKNGTVVGVSDNRVLITSNTLGDHTISTTLLDAEHVAMALHAIKVIDLRVLLATEQDKDKSAAEMMPFENKFSWPCFGRSCGIGKALKSIKQS